MSLLPLDEALDRLLALAPSVRVEDVPIEGANGRVLARDLTAQRTQPATDLSAMDGYAVAGEGPWRMIGESRAGAPLEVSLAPGECARISTGAAMPNRSDAVLLQENAHIAEGQVAASDSPPEARYIRRRGFDFASGDTLLCNGTPIGPAQIALALAGGHGHVPVARRPRVAVLECGDELVRDPAQATATQLPASNGAMVAAMLEGLVGSCERCGPIADDRAALARALDDTCEADILITTGGASVGEHDLVRGALIESGADLAFWKVAMKPGKPLMVATRASAQGRRQVVLGLPGNPVSAFVTAFVFALPLVRAALGIANPSTMSVRIPCDEALPATGTRCEFVRAGLRDGRVFPMGSQDSSALATLARADCLIMRPANACIAETREPVDVLLLHNGGNIGV